LLTIIQFESIKHGIGDNVGSFWDFGGVILLVWFVLFKEIVRGLHLRFLLHFLLLDWFLHTLLHLGLIFRLLNRRWPYGLLLLHNNRLFKVIEIRQVDAALILVVYWVIFCEKRCWSWCLTIIFELLWHLKWIWGISIHLFLIWYYFRLVFRLHLLYLFLRSVNLFLLWCPNLHIYCLLPIRFRWYHQILVISVCLIKKWTFGINWVSVSISYWRWSSNDRRRLFLHYGIDYLCWSYISCNNILICCISLSVLIDNFIFTLIEIFNFYCGKFLMSFLRTKIWFELITIQL
jgi:hypothetical protein